MIPFGCKISVVNPLDKIFAFLFSFFFPLSSFNRKWLSSFLSINNNGWDFPEIFNSKLLFIYVLFWVADDLISWGWL